MLLKTVQNAMINSLNVFLRLFLLLNNSLKNQIIKLMKSNLIIVSKQSKSTPNHSKEENFLKQAGERTFWIMVVGVKRKTKDVAEIYTLSF